MQRETYFEVGEHVKRAAQKLVDAGKGSWGKFNDIRLEYLTGDDADSIAARYTADMKAQSEAYSRSPAGIEAERQRLQRIADDQAKHDALMGSLDALDWTSDVAVLNWLCAMQEPSDHIGVKVERDKILSAFRDHGFISGANCGPLYKPDDRDNVFRYLVGQAMDGLQSVAIHGVIHKFAADWKKKFAA